MVAEKKKKKTVDTVDSDEHANEHRDDNNRDLPRGPAAAAAAARCWDGHNVAGGSLLRWRRDRDAARRHRHGARRLLRINPNRQSAPILLENWPASTLANAARACVGDSNGKTAAYERTASTLKGWFRALQLSVLNTNTP